VRVTVSEGEVYDFGVRWPCFGPYTPFSFTFDKRNGDLVDMAGDKPGRHDEAGVLALSEDAWMYACKRLKLDNPRA